MGLLYNLHTGLSVRSDPCKQTCVSIYSYSSFMSSLVIHVPLTGTGLDAAGLAVPDRAELGIPLCSQAPSDVCYKRDNLGKVLAYFSLYLQAGKSGMTKIGEKMRRSLIN